jgi:hypothetical protein
MRRNPSELRRIARSATPTDARRPPGLRTSVVLTKFPNSEQAPLRKLRQAERALCDSLRNRKQPTQYLEKALKHY